MFLTWTTIWLVEQTNLSPSGCVSIGFYKNPLLPPSKFIWLHLYSEKQSCVLTSDQRNKIRNGWRKLRGGMQILLFICIILALDCCPCFLLNSTLGPTRKLRCISWLQTPLCFGAFTANVYSNLKLICGFPMVMLLGKYLLQWASHSLQQLRKLQEDWMCSPEHGTCIVEPFTTPQQSFTWVI